MSDLGNIFSQEPLRKAADTRSIFDKAKEEGIPFKVAFDRAVKNSKYYHIPEEMKLRNNLKKKLRTMLDKVLSFFN